MEERILPAVVTTLEALNNCINQELKLIYIVKDVYSPNKQTIQNKMHDNWYALWELVGNNGVFYGKDISINDIRIEDPANIYLKIAFFFWACYIQGIDLMLFALKKGVLCFVRSKKSEEDL